MPVKIRLRRDVSSVWQLVNPLLLDGEPAFETDTGKMKIGDGEKTYNALPYTSGLKVEGLTEYLGKPNGIAPLNEDKTIPSEYLPAIPVPDSIPKGVIVMWSGTLATIPAGWALCDGTNGTPDLQNKFIRGATPATLPGTQGGADTVTLATANLPSHAHTTGSHTHTFSGTTVNTMHGHGIAITNGGVNQPSSTFPLSGITAAAAATNIYRLLTGVIPTDSGSHSHSFSGTTEGASGTTGSTGTGTAIDNRPAYYTLAYIIKI